MGKQTKRVALYFRVSTGSQTTDNQRRELEAAVERHGWNVVQVFTDEGISGAKGREGRPGLDALLKAVARRQVDLVAAWSVDRLGRSLQDLVGLLSELHAKGVDLYLHQQGLDTSTPTGKAMFQMVGVFAELERAIIRERVNAGLARVREEEGDATKRRARRKAGKRGIGRPSTDPKVEAAIRKGRNGGKGILKIARELGVGVSVVQRVVGEMAEART